MVTAFCLFVVLASAMIYRVFFVVTDEGFAAAAQTQSTYTLDVLETRGFIYDCNFQPLVNREPQYLAAVSPNPQAAMALAQVTAWDQREALAQQLRAGYPFVVPIEKDILYAKGVEVFSGYRRYDAQQLAPHVIGHLNGDNTTGVYGIEKAYDEFLRDSGSHVTVRYQVDANRKPLLGSTPEITSSYSRAGVVLTLDSRIQAIAQQAAASIEKGAIVVMDVQTGEIKAAVSKPAFDPNNLQASLDDPDAPFVNRAFHTEYNVGSTFKLVDTLAAVEDGLDLYTQYECKGYVMVGDVRFNCHNLNGHGMVDLNTAVEKSCNTYFIQLAQDLGLEHVISLAAQIGFGSSAVLAPDTLSAAGNLPGSDELRNPADVANVAFGQGTLTATPLQIAQLVAVIANGGHSVQPSLVRGTTLDGLTLGASESHPESLQLVSPRTAAVVRRFMINTVENQSGSGTKAMPEQGGAGGKTGSAQTGIFVDDEEIVQAWFAGFFPAEQPRYAVAIVVEGGNSGADVSAPIFKEIADGIGIETE